MPEVWTEKYRPKTLDEYVWRDPQQRRQIEQWLDDGSIPHLMFSGAQGIGKTSLAKLILRLLRVQKGDILEVNASRERNLDVVRDKISNFVTTFPIGDYAFKYVLLDEADYMNSFAQGALRGEMEKYVASTRFILTCCAAGTKVYTPNGFFLIEDMHGGEAIKTRTDVQTNQAIRRTRAGTLLNVKTAHALEIKVTPEHRFWTGETWKEAKELQVHDRLIYDATAIFGNDYASEPKLSLLDKEAFVEYLKLHDIPSRALLDFLRCQRKKLINPTYVKALQQSAVIDGGEYTVGTLSSVLGFQRHTVRRLLRELLLASVATREKQCGLNGELTYKINLQMMRDHVANFTTEVVKFGYQHVDYGRAYYWAVQKHKTGMSLSIEDIVERCAEGFVPENLATVARLSGFLFGDAHLSRRGMSFAANNADTLSRVVTDLQRIAPHQKERLKIEPNGYDSKGLKVQFSDRALSLFFGFVGVPAGAKIEGLIMPKLCEHSSFFRPFVQALWDNDGNAPRLHRNGKTFDSFALRQNVLSELGTSEFHETLVRLLKQHCDITATLHYSKPFKTKGLTLPSQDERMRRIATVQVFREKDMLKFFRTIGSHYECTKARPDFMAYMLYKREHHLERSAFTFKQWVDAFDVQNGAVRDKVTQIKRLEGEVEVFDCCLNVDHSYVTNGLVSHNCNYPQRIIPALHSRVQSFHFQALDRDGFTGRIFEILLAENVEFEVETVAAYTNQFYPDMRKSINEIQKNVVAGKLAPPTVESDTKDYIIEMLDLFRAGKTLEARKLIIAQAQPEEYIDIFRFFYRNLELWGDTQDIQDEAVLVICRGLERHASVADPEINLAATLIELSHLQK